MGHKTISDDSAMMQISGEGEASAARIKSTMHALAADTAHTNKFSVEYAWQRKRKNHPEIMNPVGAKGNEERRVDWLTYKNITVWNARAKQMLVNIGMARDEPGEIRECALHLKCCLNTNMSLSRSPFSLFLDGVMSEISLIHPDDVNWFVR